MVALSEAGCAVRCHRHVEGDLSESETWRGLLDGVALVFHLAAQTSARVAEEHPEVDRRINVESTMHLVQHARRLPHPPIVVFSSTDTVAGRLKGEVRDGCPDQPLTIYDLHKLQAEQVLEWGTRRGFVRGVILRLSTVYGPGGKVSRLDRGVINSMIMRALRREALTVFGDGTCLRDLLHVEDAVEALCLAAQRVDSLEGDHFVVGSGSSTEIGSAFRLIAEAAAKVTGHLVPVAHVPWPESTLDIDRRSVQLDPSRFCQYSGWTSKHRFETAVFETARLLALGKP